MRDDNLKRSITGGLLFTNALVIVAAFKLRGQDETTTTYRAPTALLVVGLVGNALLLGYVVHDDPASLIWCAGLIGLGVVLFLIEYARGSQEGSADAETDHPGQGGLRCTSSSPPTVRSSRSRLRGS